MDFGQLLDKYLTNSITPAEKALLFDMLRSGTHQHALEQAVGEALAVTEPATEDPVLRETLFIRIQKRKQPKRIRWWYAAAAAAAIIAGIIICLPHPTVPPQQTIQQIIPAGTSKASLTLADGSIITLDSNGHRTIQQGATAVRQQGGQLLYNVQGSHATLSYNTLTTPRGGQFKVTLPDGSNVWLNAASSLRYPTAFTGKERMVAITGEAYFEIAQNASMPFKVSINGRSEVEVLGTSFNVNAYTDEAAIRTTLLDGSIRIDKQLVLKPGQQAEGLVLHEHADTEQAVAWKNGLFNFNGQDLTSVMKQIARWYDVEVIYQGNIPPRRFFGEIERDLQLADVLEILQKAEVHFKIEGRKLIVMP